MSTHIQIFTCARARTRAHIHTETDTHTHAHAHTHAHPHTHTHRHAHTHMFWITVAWKRGIMVSLMGTTPLIYNMDSSKWILRTNKPISHMCMFVCLCVNTYAHMYECMCVCRYMKVCTNIIHHTQKNIPLGSGLGLEASAPPSYVHVCMIKRLDVNVLRVCAYIPNACCKHLCINTQTSENPYIHTKKPY